MTRIIDEVNAEVLKDFSQGEIDSLKGALRAIAAGKFEA